MSAAIERVAMSLESASTYILNAALYAAASYDERTMAEMMTMASRVLLTVDSLCEAYDGESFSYWFKAAKKNLVEAVEHLRKWRLALSLDRAQEAGQGQEKSEGVQ
jgi:hypothetical protein